MLSKARIIKSSVSAVVLALAFAPAAHAGLTGHVDVVSKYVLRGITMPASAGPEQDGPAMQGGLDYVADSGFYAGYWFSTLGYDANSGSGRTSTENDFYAGYNGKAGDFGYTVGATYYVYSPGEDFNALETKLGLSYGAFSVTAQTALQDVIWANTGDTYFLATYTKALPKDFTFTGQLGAYYYTEDGDFITGTTETMALRHLTVGVTHPIGTTGATWGLQYVGGGKDRMGVTQKGQLVGSLVVGF